MSSKLRHADIWQFPKADLHRHLDGSIKPEVVMRLAKKFGVKLPTDDLKEFKEIFQIVDKMSISELFKRFAWAIAVMRDPEGLEEAFYQQILDLAEENIFYAELRFAPGYHSIYPAPFYRAADYERQPLPVMSLELVVELALEGIKRGRRETGVEANLILCIPRECHRQYGIWSAFEIAELAKRWQDRGVVAIDLACDESRYPPEIYAKVFRSTLKSKIRRVPHAGEMAGKKQGLLNIRTCLEALAADGLGHALPLHHSRDLIETVKRKKIRIERIPLSPVYGKKLGEDGFHKLLKAGVLITINSDDPVLMRHSLTDNFAAALSFYDWGEEYLQKLVGNSLNSAFFRNAAQKKRVQKLFISKGLKRQVLKP